MYRWVSVATARNCSLTQMPIQQVFNGYQVGPVWERSQVECYSSSYWSLILGTSLDSNLSSVPLTLQYAEYGDDSEPLLSKRFGSFNSLSELTFISDIVIQCYQPV